jgi:hypothetical protein
MSTPNEVFFEPLVSVGSHYASWSSHVLNALRTMGPNVERILVASILPPKRSWIARNSMLLLLTTCGLFFVKIFRMLSFR